MRVAEAGSFAATMGFTDIHLREHEKNERGEYKVHVFEGSIEKVRKSKKSF